MSLNREQPMRPFLDELADAFEAYEVPAGSIGTNELADGAVTGPKIADGAVDMDKLADDVLIPQPTDAQVTSAVNAVLAEHPEWTTTVQDGSITGPKIADDTIPDSKLVQSGGMLEEVGAIYDVLPKTSETVVRVTADAGATWETGKFYCSSSGAVGGTLTQANYTALSCAVYGTVNADDIFTVKARSAGSGYALIIVDSNNVVIEQFISPNGTSYYDDATYTVLHDGTMYLNTYTADYLTGSKVYKLSQHIENLTPIKSPLDSVKWVSFGDSIVEYNATAEANWVKDMVDGTNAVNINLASSGSGFYRYSPLEGYSTLNYISKITSVPSDVEFITVAGSFNDLTSSPWPTLPVGTSSDRGTTTIAGYMNDFFDTLLAQFPTVPIAVVMTNPWDVYKPGTQRSDDYVRVLGEICQKNGIPFYADCYYGCNLKPWIAANKTTFFTRASGYVDGIHPNTAGHVFLYRMLRPFLEKCAHTTV